jgi:hypothetical protein
VAVLEAVRQRLGDAVDAHLHALDDVLLQPTGIRCSREPRDLQRQIRSGLAGTLRDREPDPVGALGAELVEAQRREQADHAVRHALAGLDQAVMLGENLIDGQVEAPADPLQFPALPQPVEVRARQAEVVQVARAKYATLRRQLAEALGGGVGCDDKIVSIHI